MRKLPAVTALLAGVLLLLLSPQALHAWGPGTHVQLGLDVLRSLDLLAPGMGALLQGHALEFLYGSLAADIPMGKSYVSLERHPHAWRVAEEMLESAEGDPELEAAALGYMSHLAADVVAHESFVPRMLLLTSSTRALGHSYWEHRMEVAAGPDHTRLARTVVMDFDQSRIDGLLDEVLERTIFSFSTNRKIFRGMVRIADDRRWQSLFDTVVENSRWDLEEREIELYQREALRHVLGFLAPGEGSRAREGDPTGRDAITRAKKIRRQVLLEEGWGAGDALQAAADRFYPLPEPEASGEALETGGTPEAALALQMRLLDRQELPQAS